MLILIRHQASIATAEPDDISIVREELGAGSLLTRRRVFSNTQLRANAHRDASVVGWLADFLAYIRKVPNREMSFSVSNKQMVLLL